MMHSHCIHATFWPYIHAFEDALQQIWQCVWVCPCICNRTDNVFGFARVFTTNLTIYLSLRILSALEFHKICRNHISYKKPPFFISYFVGTVFAADDKSCQKHYHFLQDNPFCFLLFPPMLTHAWSLIHSIKYWIKYNIELHTNLPYTRNIKSNSMLQ